MDGRTLSGTYYAPTEAGLLVVHDGERLEVALPLIAAVRVGDQAVPLTTFEAWLIAAALVEPPRSPSPLAVGAASLAWAGGGHLLLGDPGQAAGWALVDAVLVSSAVLSAAAAHDRATAITLGALDVGLRAAACAESWSRARSRRNRLRPALRARGSEGVDGPQG